MPWETLTISIPKSGAWPVIPNTVVFRYFSCPARSMKVITLEDVSHILNQSRPPPVVWKRWIQMGSWNKGLDFSSLWESQEAVLHYFKQIMNMIFLKTNMSGVWLGPYHDAFAGDGCRLIIDGKVTIPRHLGHLA